MCPLVVSADGEAVGRPAEIARRNCLRACRYVADDNMSLPESEPIGRV